MYVTSPYSNTNRPRRKAANTSGIHSRSKAPGAPTATKTKVTDSCCGIRFRGKERTDSGKSAGTVNLTLIART
jgi:hypothetical protein